MEIEACDVSRNALEFAADNCQQAGAEVRLFPLDVLQDPIIKTYDAVMWMSPAPVAMSKTRNRFPLSSRARSQIGVQANAALPVHRLIRRKPRSARRWL